MFTILGIIAGHLKYKTRRIRLKGFTIRVQLADSGLKRAIGLMYRKHLQSGTGMLFVFDSAGLYGIWMKNMRFPIDIAWADEAKAIIHIVNSAQPCKSMFCKVYKPPSNAKYVLELESGFLKSHNIKKGDRIKLDSA